MINRVRPLVAPGYLFLCLLLGGSAQAVWGNAALRLIAILIIAWALLERGAASQQRAIKQLVVLIGLMLALALVQLVPLPIPLWASLPGRSQFLEGFRLLGMVPSGLPISLSPYDSVSTLLSLLPPLGMLAAVVGLRGYSAP